MATQTQTLFTTVTIKKEITVEQIKSMLVTALETPCGSWFRVTGANFAPGLTRADFQQIDGFPTGKFCDPEEYYASDQIIPVTPGCALRILVDRYTDNLPNEWEPNVTPAKTDGHRLLLTPEKLVAGVQVMAEKYPKHFNDWMNQNDDAITGDIFLQCCLFGEEIFG